MPWQTLWLRTTSGCAPDHTRMWSHSYHPVLLEKPRETNISRTSGRHWTPHFLSASFPSFQATARHFPSQILPWFADQHLQAPCHSRAMWILPVAGVLPVQAQLTEQQPQLGLRIPADTGREEWNQTLWRRMIIKGTFSSFLGFTGTAIDTCCILWRKLSHLQGQLRQRESGKDVISSAGIWPELMQPSWEGQGDMQGPVHSASWTAAQLLQE